MVYLCYIIYTSIKRKKKITKCKFICNPTLNVASKNSSYFQDALTTHSFIHDTCCTLKNPIGHVPHLISIHSRTPFHSSL